MMFRVRTQLPKSFIATPAATGLFTTAIAWIQGVVIRIKHPKDPYVGCATIFCWKKNINKANFSHWSCYTHRQCKYDQMCVIVCIYIYIYIYMHACCMYMYVYIHIYVCVCVLFGLLSWSLVLLQKSHVSWIWRQHGTLIHLWHSVPFCTSGRSEIEMDLASCDPTSDVHLVLQIVRPLITYKWSPSTPINCG